MIISSGLIIMAGFLLLLVKLPIKTTLWLLGHSLALDIAITVLAYALHWGTFTGVMAAAFAGLLCSVTTWSAKKLIGYIHKGKYYPGFWSMREKLKPASP